MASAGAQRRASRRQRTLSPENEPLPLSSPRRRSARTASPAAEPRARAKSDYREHWPEPVPQGKETPWFLNVDGVMTTKRDGICEECIPSYSSDRYEDYQKPPGFSLLPPGKDITDFPTYAASSPPILARFLPLLPQFQHLYEKQPDGTWKLTGKLYFVVEGVYSVIKNIELAYRYQYWNGGAESSITALSCRDAAKALTKAQRQYNIDTYG
ncbi:hypothetical protein C8R47DRAFT_1223222 [Mycena vitilis]|nr:hypothetical protein C8R47DRAFT_1223222 [Mycena vitilis]